MPVTGVTDKERASMMKLLEKMQRKPAQIMTAVSMKG